MTELSSSAAMESGGGRKGVEYFDEVSPGAARSARGSNCADAP